jgi:hypothetical protein
MSWVRDCLQKRKSIAQLRPVKAVYVSPPASWHATWSAIYELVTIHVLEFNRDRGPQFMVHTEGDLLRVVPMQLPPDTVVLEVDDGGIIQLTCPISHPGLPRRGTFKMESGGICSVGDLVGQPASPADAMTPEQFSEFVLKPLLFPEL